MSIFAISDLHLSFSCDKPMDIFGKRWEGYIEKLIKNWNFVVNTDDIVIMPGDTSWGMYLEECFEDFKFLNELNGKKVILKGNHDYWWNSKSKLKKYILENNFDTIGVIQNDCFIYKDTAICGTRGWMIPQQSSEGLNKKIFEREKLRLILSLEDAKKKPVEEIVVAMHYPPVDFDSSRADFIEIMKQYGVKKCIYGHLHGTAHKKAICGMFDGIDLKLVSCDYINFTPMLIKI